MLTDKDYCNYETCVALAELGITYCGLHFYVVGDKDILCSNILQPMTTRTAEVLNYVLAIPLYVAQKFLREEHDAHVHICRPHPNKGSYVWSNTVFLHGCEVSSRGFFLSYEEALSEGIKEAIKILKDK